MIIDAEKLVLGRVAAIAAKTALMGNDVQIVNCEKAIIIGSRKHIMSNYMLRLDLGQPQQGPYVQRRPDLFVRHAVRGMLPNRQPKGQDAYRRVKCFIGAPSTMQGAVIVKKALPKQQPIRFMSVADLCIHLGWKRNDGWKR